MDDHELLRNYADHGAEDAFRDLVSRHLGMVYAASIRMVRDPHLAQEVAQNVFVLLARRAASVKPPQVIAGWLYKTSQNLAKQTLRTEQRRRLREEKAAVMHTSDSVDPTVGRILDDLESAIGSLESGDRDAIVLRYFEDRSLRDVGVELGVSEDAARMRVNRAVDRLRGVFEARGLGVTSVVLVTALSASSTATPAGLAASATAAALAGTTTAIAITTMNWINAKTISALLATAILAGTGGYMVQEERLETLRKTNTELLARQEAGRNEGAPVPVQPEDTAGVNASPNTELLQLRNQVTQLQRQLHEARQAAASSRIASAPEKQPAARPASPYLTKAGLVHSGFATPEAGIQTAAWATVNGREGSVSECLSPELVADSQAMAIFERNRKAFAPVFQGMQLIAKKPVDDTHVEMKVRYDVGLPNGGGSMPVLVVVPMVKTDAGWKLGSTRDYHENWEQSGNIEVLAE